MEKMKRVEVEEKNSTVTLTFNKNLYPQELIEQAISDFKDACEAAFQNEKLVLRPKSDEIKADVLGYEFYNYLLGLIKG